MSILTAIEHLPASTETAPERVTERMREKEVIRTRLLRLCEETPAVLEVIRRAVAELHNSEDPTSFDRLDALINNQPYRLSSWKVASEEINYRRFFDVNTLAAIRMDLPEVFDATHQLLLELIGKGAVNGLRIDHIDGLANPRGDSSAPSKPVREQPLAARGKSTPFTCSWKKFSGLPRNCATTGLFTAPPATSLPIRSPNCSWIAQRSGNSPKPTTASSAGSCGFHELVYRCKKLVMQVSLASEVNVLGHLLNRLSESHRWYRDFTVNALTAAVRETIACFRVYRTYRVPGDQPTEADTRVIYRALAEARRRNPALERTVFEFLRDVLLPPEPNPHPIDETLRREFVLKFQQCTSPIAAKGVEDTAFYQYHRLIALNEV